MKTMQNQLTACDIASTKQLLDKIKDHGGAVAGKVKELTEMISSSESVSTELGISFLDVKNQLLGQYNMDLANIVQQKVNGKQIEGCTSVERLVQMRTYIEKIRPIERKLKYQMEKLLKIASSGGLSSDDPLHLKPNPGNMTSKFKDQEEDNSESDLDSDMERSSSKKEGGVYKPPMMSAAYFEEEVSRKEKDEAMLVKAKKRALNTAMMRELRAEYSEAPEEVRDDLNLHRIKQSKSDQHRTDYEEDNFKRVMLTKDEKRRQKRMQTIGSLDQITKFGDISALAGLDSFDTSNKKRKSKSKGSSKKKKKKFR